MHCGNMFPCSPFCSVSLSFSCTCFYVLICSVATVLFLSTVFCCSFGLSAWHLSLCVQSFLHSFSHYGVLYVNEQFWKCMFFFTQFYYFFCLQCVSKSTFLSNFYLKFHLQAIDEFQIIMNINILFNDKVFNAKYILHINVNKICSKM